MSNSRKKKCVNPDLSQPYVVEKNIYYGLNWVFNLGEFQRTEYRDTAKQTDIVVVPCNVTDVSTAKLSVLRTAYCRSEYIEQKKM